MHNGIINIYKEKGFTSFDVVAKMRGIIGQKKIGHTGTLDPDAEGVLPVCLGNGTKLCDLLTDKHKEYIAELMLGVETDTQDLTGTVIKEAIVNVSEEEVKSVLMSFLGDYEQIPPMYSALKVNGKKLYELAREGKVIERKARLVHIDEIEILEMNLPVVKFRVACSKGTYIRTLCTDVGEKLGCFGSMKSLLRSRVDQFRMEDAITLSDLQKVKDEGHLSDVIISVDAMFPQLPKMIVKKEFQKVLDNGNPLQSRFFMERLENVIDGQEILVYSEDKKFYAIYGYSAERKCFKPVKMFMS